MTQSSHNVSLSSLHEFLTRTIAANRTSMQVSQTDHDLTWLSPEIKTEMVHRNYLNREWRNPLLNEQEREVKRSLYKRQRNKVTAMIRLSKRSEIDAMTRDACGDNTRMWKVVNYVLTNRRQAIKKALPTELLSPSGALIDTPSHIADQFVDFFADVSEDRNEINTHCC